MKYIKMGPEDIPNIGRVFVAIQNCLSSLPKDIMESGRCGGVIVQALLNVVCKIAIDFGIKKETFDDAFNQIWEGRENLDTKIEN